MRSLLSFENCFLSLTLDYAVDDVLQFIARNVEFEW